jgi:hypothetical protein
VPEPQHLLEVNSIVDCARSLWREACDQATTAHLELFAKVAVRSRATRELSAGYAKFDRVFESGLALRAFAIRRDQAGFAAVSGLSKDAVRWAVDSASAFRAQAPLPAPRASDVVAAERWDLDASESLPDEETLSGGLLTRPQLEWIEAGTTVEVLIGTEGWIAARRRHRVWARSRKRLVAQRGIAGWERMLDDSSDGSSEPPGSSMKTGALVLTPDAAAPVVEALVTAFHGKGAIPANDLGRGWSVTDEPTRPDGLAGGSFDDVGFPASTRALATDGVWVGRLEGPGTYRRSSFREPPTESATNLCMPSGPSELMFDGCAIVERCRILRPSRELWVMEIDGPGVGNGGGVKRRWIRVKPKSLLSACRARLGRSTVTSSGPIVPALKIEGLRTE